MLEVLCLPGAGFAGNYAGLCLAARSSGVAGFIVPIGYFGCVAKLSSEERKARDAAFAALLAGMNPESALRQEMIGARVRAGLTQAELGFRMGTTQSVIARLERGGRSPSVRTLRRLAEVTGSRLVVRLEVAAFRELGSGR